MFNKSEDRRRTVNLNFDTAPSFLHIFNFESSKKYIKNKVVLDIGCWTGQLERLAGKTAKKMVAIDPSNNAITFAKRGLTDVTFKVAKADNLPFKNSYFDTVLLLDVIEHVPSKTEKDVFREIYRVTKPGGNLIITTPNKHLLSILLDPAYFLLGHRHYSAKEIEVLLNQAGFKIKKVRLVGNIASLMHSNISLFFKYTVGAEPIFLQNAKEFFLNQHKKNNGFAFLYIVAEVLK